MSGAYPKPGWCTGCCPTPWHGSAGGGGAPAPRARTHLPADLCPPAFPPRRVALAQPARQQTKPQPDVFSGRLVPGAWWRTLQGIPFVRGRDAPPRVRAAFQLATTVGLRNPPACANAAGWFAVPLRANTPSASENRGRRSVARAGGARFLQRMHLRSRCTHQPDGEANAGPQPRKQTSRRLNCTSTSNVFILHAHAHARLIIDIMSSAIKPHNWHKNQSESLPWRSVHTACRDVKAGPGKR